jgi:hypothetical protein
VDSPKDELGSAKQGEEIPEQEIGISTTNYQVSIEPSPDSSILASNLPLDEQQLEAKLSGHMEEVQEPNLEHIYTVGSLGNMLTCGEQKIPEPMDEVIDIQDIAYDLKRRAIMKITTKKMRITMDISILITTEEKLISTEHAKTS